MSRTPRKLQNHMSLRVPARSKPARQGWGPWAAWKLWKNWKPWADNPIVVVIILVVALIGIIPFITGKGSLPTLLGSETQNSKTQEFSPILEPTIDPKITVMPPTSLYESQSVLLFENQVLLKTTAILDDVASFRIEIPDQEPIYWGTMPVGTRKTFTYNGTTYFFTLLEVKNGRAKVIIDKKL